ncbi:porin family protein [Mannheimia sp. AT1]|uniref:Porin family protein n=1 Tax=Mannheimia cairinae TaxID=3025936 RepID=A0ABT5MPB3_9PAST|nr:porin family protein [Mannheimia cairinae]MDD0823436.1 porin family protein [Mannheimia cairinae]MDD0826956.1 porin family protein [Mannheimia cairinae]
MKKLTLALACLFSVNAFAAPVGNTFTGVGVGVDLATTKYKVDGVKGKQSTGPALIVDYGIEQGNNFVGIVQGKAKIGSTKVFNDVKQKNKYTIAYQQGYRVGSDLLPYIKVDASSSKVGNETFRGFGFGAGAKYAVSSDIEIGAEYTRDNLKRSGTKLRGNVFSANAAYRF